MAEPKKKVRAKSDLQSTPPGQHAPPSPAQSSPDASGLSGGGCLVRLGWMILGPAVLVLSTLSILKHKGGFFAPADVIFWIIVAAMILLRRVDVLRMSGLTATGRKATLADWKRYVILLLVAAIAVWAGAHGYSRL